IANQGQVPVVVRARLVDWTLTEPGEMKLLPTGTTPASLAGLVTFAPEEFSLGPGESGWIHPTLSLPAEGPATRWGALPSRGGRRVGGGARGGGARGAAGARGGARGHRRAGHDALPLERAARARARRSHRTRRHAAPGGLARSEGAGPQSRRAPCLRHRRGLP